MFDIFKSDLQIFRFWWSGNVASEGDVGWWSYCVRQKSHGSNSVLMDLESFCPRCFTRATYWLFVLSVLVALNVHHQRQNQLLQWSLLLSLSKQGRRSGLAILAHWVARSGWYPRAYTWRDLESRLFTVVYYCESSMIFDHLPVFQVVQWLNLSMLSIIGDSYGLWFV